MPRESHRDLEANEGERADTATKGRTASDSIGSDLRMEVGTLNKLFNVVDALECRRWDRATCRRRATAFASSSLRAPSTTTRLVVYAHIYLEHFPTYVGDQEIPPKFSQEAAMDAVELADSAQVTAADLFLPILGGAAGSPRFLAKISEVIFRARE